MTPLTLALFFLLLSLPFILYRLLRGPEWTDRLIATDLLALSLSAGILLLKHESGWGWDRDAAWILMITSFVGTIGASFAFNSVLRAREGKEVKRSDRNE